MAGLTDTTIAASYDQLLIVDRDGGGNGTTHVTVKDGDGTTTFPITLATDAIMITSTNRLEFGDDASYIHQSADGVLDLVSDTEIELTATTIDINGAVDMSSTLAVAGAVTITTATNYAMTIKSTDADAADIFRIIADDDGALFAFSKDASDDAEMYLYDGSGNANVQISGNNVSYFNGGNVGIGVSSPGYLTELRVNDTTVDTPRLVIRQLGAGDSSLAFQMPDSPYGFTMGVDNSDSDRFKISTGVGDLDSSSRFEIDPGGTTIHRYTGAENILQIHSGTGSSTTGTSQIYFSSKDEHGGNTHQSYIKSTIDGSSSTSATKMSFHNRDSGGTVQEYLTIKADGRVGIGDSSPGAPLDVKSGEAANTANFNSTNGATNITLESSGSLIGQMEFVSSGTSAIVTRTSASLALGSNNVRTLYITDNDRVGIGESSPNTALHVAASTDSTDDGVYPVIFTENGNATGNSYAGFKTRGRVDGSNNVDCFFLSDGANELGFIGTNTNYPFEIRTNGSTRMTVKSSGQIETNYGDSSYNLYINGLASSATKGILMAVGPSSGTVDQMLFRDGNGHNCGAINSDASANTTSFGTSSDYRLKENEEIISDGIERIKKLKPYRFNFISAPDQTQDGFFAHELAEHIPEAVTGKKDAMEDGEIKPQNVDYGKITPLLAGALKEAIAKIETLESKVEALENA